MFNLKLTLQDDDGAGDVHVPHPRPEQCEAGVGGCQRSDESGPGVGGCQH